MDADERFRRQAASEARLSTRSKLLSTPRPMSLVDDQVVEGAFGGVVQFSLLMSLFVAVDEGGHVTRLRAGIFALGTKGFLALGLYLLASGSLQSSQSGIVALSGANTQSVEEHAARPLPTPVSIHRGMKRGDVLAIGTRVDLNGDGIVEEDECHVSSGVEITLTSGSRTVVVGRRAGCTAVLEGVHDVDAVEPGEAR